MSGLKVGASKVDITPPIGIPMGGYAARPDVAKGIHDRLHARSVVIEGEEIVSIVSLELLHIKESVANEAKKLIRKELGIPKDNILIAAIHTHSGPSPAEHYGMAREYYELLPYYIFTAVKNAYENMQNARIGYGKGELNGWTVNRRKPMKGSLDNEVIVVRMEDLKENLIAAIVNFTCHAVVLGHNNLLISADYPGFTSSAIEAIENGVALFLNGACGDINPLTPRTDLSRVYDRSVGTFEEARKMGYALAGEAIKVLNGIRTMDNIPIKTLVKEVSVKRVELPEVSDEEIAELERKYEELTKRGKIEEASKVKFDLVLKKWLKGLRERFPSDYVTIKVQGIRLGDLVIIAFPGEVLVDIGLKIKKSSKAKLTMIVGYANGYIGYIPTKEAIKEGGYEARPPATVLTEDAEDKLVNTAIEIIDNLVST